MEKFLKQQIEITQQRLMKHPKNKSDKELNIYLRGKLSAFKSVVKYQKNDNNLRTEYPEIFNNNLTD